MPIPESCDVVVVGAGLAGLAAARILTRAGCDVHIIEASDGVGGRVRSDHVEGFILDRGFQLYNPSYSEGLAVLDLKALDFRNFTAGIMVNSQGQNFKLADPRREPTWALDSMRAPVGSLRKKLAFAKYAVSCARNLDVSDAVDQRSLAFLERSFGEKFIQSVLRPFLAGVFLEENLDTSKRFLDSVIGSFIKGSPGVPAQGMQEISNQMAAHVPLANIHVNSKVTSITDHDFGHRVTTTQATVDCRNVIVATDASAVTELIGEVTVPLTHSVTTWYHVPDCLGSELTDGKSVIVVDGDAYSRGTRDPQRILVNSVVLTNAAPSYAPDGQALISSSAIGMHDSPQAQAKVTEHLSQLYGRPTSGWRLLATYPIQHALPAMLPPHAPRAQSRIRPGIYLAGDYCEVSSINGALISGRRAATELLRERNS